MRWIIGWFGWTVFFGAGMCSSPPKTVEAQVDRRLQAADPKARVAIFAGGCFWCVQPPFDKTKGVLRTVVGYTGGPEKNPTYKQVAYGQTGHTEAIWIEYDPKKLTYRDLVEVFWRQIDPTALDRQFADVGKQYRTGIFYQTEEEGRIAEASKAALAKTGCFSKPIVVEITKAGPFYPAEEYHQSYYKKNPVEYDRYRVGSGRAGYLARRWTDKGCRRP